MPGLSDDRNHLKRKLTAMCSVSSLSMGVFKEQLYGYMMEILKTSEWETR